MLGSSTAMGTQVLCFGKPGFACTRNEFTCQLPKTQSLGLSTPRCRCVFRSSCGSHSLLVPISCTSVESRHIGGCHKDVKTVEVRRVRRRFGLGLRPRVRVLKFSLKRMLIKMGKISFDEIVEGLGAFVLKNWRRLSVTVLAACALGFCYLVLKLTAVASPTVVPYSDLVTSLQCGQVTKVLFEEGSRRIFYNTNAHTSENVLEKGLGLKDALADNSQDAVLMDKGKKKSLAKGNFLKGKGSKPAWEFSTRKIDHDENFLLNLMREKGTTYSSAPQSVLMSLRSVMITVISLWIPLAPLMWLAYRQLSAGNSPAKKRRPSSQTISFDDVEGVGAAKAELMEVSFLLSLYKLWHKY